MGMKILILEDDQGRMDRFRAVLGADWIEAYWGRVVRELLGLEEATG